MQNNIKKKPTIALPQVVAFYVGAVLGSGILILPGLAAETSGPASLLAWLLMSILGMPMALVMGLLAAKYPDSGGVSYFVTKAFNPHLGSLVGWFFLLSVVAGAPVLALTGSGYLCASIGLDDSYRLILAIAILFVGIIANYAGVKITGRLQVLVVLTTIVILAVTIIGSIQKIEAINFTPFMPHGWQSVGHSMSIIFWCFIGWEAVSHISAEFVNPERDAIIGTIIADIVISIVYFLTAFVVVGTGSFGHGVSDVSLIQIIKISFGKYSALIAGIAALFVCVAPAIAYIGAASRLACSLSMNGYAPNQFSILSKKYQSPLGGLLFLSVCFTVLLIIYSSGMMSISTLIQMPNATFILTYIGGSASGIVLLKNNKLGLIVSIVSLLLTVITFIFVRWAVLYPVVITFLWFCFNIISKIRRSKSPPAY